MPELHLCLRSSPALTGCITHLAPQPSSRTCTIDATKIANSIIKEIRKRATIWHQISGGVERAAVKSEKTIKKRRLFVKVSTERPLGSGKRITITDVATYVGKASVNCVQTKYESKGRVRKGLANEDIEEEKVPGIRKGSLCQSLSSRGCRSQWTCLTGLPKVNGMRSITVIVDPL
ncbi:hypothetical protein V6N13_048111 [Hibiscus sabdariffa]